MPEKEKQSFIKHFPFRLACGVIDNTLACFIQLLFGSLLGGSLFLLLHNCALPPRLILVVVFLISQVLIVFLFAWQESAKHQATIGMRQFGFFVTDEFNKRLSLRKAVMRNCFRSFFSPLAVMFLLIIMGAPASPWTAALALVLISLIDAVLPGVTTGIPREWVEATRPSCTGSVISIGEQCYNLATLTTARGRIKARLYESKPGALAVVAVGGCGVGFNSPAGDLYDRLGKIMMGEGVTLLWLSLRDATDLFEMIHDIRAATAFLQGRGASHVCLIGHSAGGAGVITAAAMEACASGLILLSSQNASCELIGELNSVPVLFVHGQRDRVIPLPCARQLFSRARNPKRLQVLAAGHSLRECREEVFSIVHDWLRQLYCLRRSS